MYEINEHQARAATNVADASAENRCHRRNDNECCEQRCDGVEDCYVASGARDILAFRQIGTVNNRAVACNRQGEERLAECKYPYLRVCKTGRIDLQDVLVAFLCTREGRDVDCQYEEQAEQNRHHDLVCLLNAACNAHYHDCERNDQSDDLPYAVADAEEAGRRHCLEGFAEGLSLRCGHAERTADRAHVGAEAVQAAADRQECVLEDPAENDRVADREHQRADDRDSAEGLACLIAAGPLLGAHAERAYRACLCAAAERELFNNTGSADQDNEKEVRQQEGHASVLLNHDRETPDIAHADGRTDTG